MTKRRRSSSSGNSTEHLDTPLGNHGNAAVAPPVPVPDTNGRRIVGQVKWFNVKKGWGFIIGENGEDIFVHQSGVLKAGFRSLDDGELVEYEIRNTDKGPEACNITGPSGAQVLGSQRRKRMRILQKQRKNRCFNCNVEGHIASSCPVPVNNKRCHVCLKDDHLMRQCPHQAILMAHQELHAEALPETTALPPHALITTTPSAITSVASLTGGTIRPPGAAAAVANPMAAAAAAAAAATSALTAPQHNLLTQLQLQQIQQQQLLSQLSSHQAPAPLLQHQQLLQVVPEAAQGITSTPQLYYTALGAAQAPQSQPILYYLPTPRFPHGPQI